jgi:hypothetical protein
MKACCPCAQGDYGWAAEFFCFGEPEAVIQVRSIPIMPGAVLVLAAAGPVWAQVAAQDNSPALLDRLRAHMAEMLATQPNYTCVETIERASLGQREDVYRVRDVVRLEVALVDHKEMFAWPGSKEFEDASLRTFVPTGMFGNGYFGMYADAIFRGTHTELKFRGESQLDQRTVLRYDFRVPAVSGTEIHTMDVTATVGYRGTLYADAGTLDVLKLEVAAENMPVRLGLRKATGTAEYARVRIGENEVLLPTAGESVMLTWMGDASRNRMRFSECREFTGTSTVAFGDTPRDAAEAARAAKKELQLPRGLSVALRLVDENNTDEMAIGDPVHAVLDEDLKAGGKLLFAKGTAVSGRVVQLMHVGNYTVVGLTFLEAESETAHAALELTFQRATGTELNPQSPRWERLTPRTPHAGLIGLKPRYVHLGRGIVLYWRT